MKEHDTIVLKHDVPEYGLETGDIGTIVHRYKSPDNYEVEFVTGEGRTLGVIQLSDSDIRTINNEEILHVRELKAA